jgi:hypothetical protein
LISAEGESAMRRLLLCLVLLGAVARPALAEAPLPIHDCLEGGSMDYTPADAATLTPTPSTGS